MRHLLIMTAKSRHNEPTLTIEAEEWRCHTVQARCEKMLHHMGRDTARTHRFNPYRLVTIGVRNAIGRYTHPMMLPSQLTSLRVNPKSRTTEGRQVSYVRGYTAEPRTVVGYRAKPRPACGTHSFQRKLSNN